MHTLGMLVRENQNKTITKCTERDLAYVFMLLCARLGTVGKEAVKSAIECVCERARED